MSPIFSTYALLGIAICAEVAGSAFLKASDGFTRLGPSLAVLAFYTVAFYFLALSLRDMPLGIAYAVWSGLGIVLTAIIGLMVFRQTLDLAAILGIVLILTGVLVMNLFSSTAGH